MSSNIRVITPPDTLFEGRCPKIILLNVTLPHLTRAIDQIWDKNIDLDLYLCNNTEDVWLEEIANKADKILAYDVVPYAEKISKLKTFVKYSDYKGLLNELST